MKQYRTLWITFALLIVVASLYRVWDGRPLGFAPQIAMAIFAGSVIKNKKWAFILPLASMFFSDALYQVLYINGVSDIPGFYSGQITNYILFTSLTVIGFWLRKFNWVKLAAAAIVAPTVYFLLSNGAVWMGGGGYGHPQTFNGLMLTLQDGLPFYRGSIEATFLFSALLFGGYFMIRKAMEVPKHQLV